MKNVLKNRQTSSPPRQPPLKKGYGPKPPLPSRKPKDKGDHPCRPSPKKA
ncbi:MAG: hypothetical protein JW884_01510 [Deltaproteobacteria bacterium]|nr:hypothetical protein [Deltaproteobacteria bacterium]